MLSSIMGIALLVTSSLMANLYVKYCDSLQDYWNTHTLQPNPSYDYFPEKCEENERHFLILPLFGFSTMAAWVRY